MKKLDPVLTIYSKQTRRKKFRDNYLNILYMIPVLLGIFVFTLLPMGVSLFYSFQDINLLSPITNYSAPNFNQYIRAFTSDWGKMSHSYYITFRYSIIIGGINFIGSYIVALILNQKLKGMKTFRILYYTPCLIPAIASSLLWNGITRETGYFNLILVKMGLEPYTFYSSNSTVFLTQLILSGWSFSGGMIMWLAQFKNIPNDLYEEAKLSGAGYFQQLRHVTIPLSTSMIFYNLIMTIIGSLQSFTAYTTYLQYNRPSDLRFVGLLIYETAYVDYDISYASALSWILFVVIGILTAVVLKTSNQWVYYAEEN